MTAKSDESKRHGHYYKDVSALRTIDVYRVIQLFEVTDPCLQHALKKIMCAGRRGGKDVAKDVQEAIDTLRRWQEMLSEDAATESTQLSQDLGLYDESRADIIGQNGNDGEHYPKAPWGEAPEDAEWFAVDDDGSGWWFTVEPEKDDCIFVSSWHAYYEDEFPELAGHKERRPC